ncbi:MAG: hemerythrin domain-containing protein [Candidatus Nitrosopolaris sp.]
MEYNIDFSEPIPKMVQRLRAEHRYFRLELFQIEEANEVSSHKAIEMLKQLRKPILRHTVEEEARIMRIIMQKAKEQSEHSVKVLQEHKEIINFLEKRISQLEGSSQDIAKEINTEMKLENISQKRRKLFFLLH